MKWAKRHIWTLILMGFISCKSSCFVKSIQVACSQIGADIKQYWGFSSIGSESRRCALQMRIWEKILCSWACAAYCQNCEPNSHALRAQTVVLRSDAMRAHSRIFKQMLIL